MPELVLPRLDRPRGVSDDMKRTLPNDQTFTLGRCRPERSRGRWRGGGQVCPGNCFAGWAHRSTTRPGR